MPQPEVEKTNGQPRKKNEDPVQSPIAKDFLVVGLGASAGGIKALKEFFENVSERSNCAYVVILHLSPDFESKLAEILQTVSPIPVAQVREERVKVEPNNVYVIPPNKSLQMVDSYLQLSPITTYEERRAPVDIFFRTLAENADGRSVAVILSGTGPNGSMGVKRVKEKGGIIIVQEPQEAEYNDMPHASLDTGLVDYILPVRDIPAQILQYRDHMLAAQAETDKAAHDKEERDEEAVRDIFTQLRVRTGHDFSSYKRATVMRRIARRMGVREVESLADYAELFRAKPDEAEALLKDLLISVTNFFRDRAAFEALEKKVIPALLKGKRGDDPLRIWVAGCATGEEAYSIAMLLAEATATMSEPPVVQIFATDIDEDAIATAREGIYTNSDVADVSPERLRRFFIEEDKNVFRIRRELRECILFAHHNVLRDPPFSHLDLATCRNLLIYLNRAAQSRVLQTVHFALEPGGYLLLGSAESIDGTGDLYVEVDREQCIFQSRAVQNRPVLPLPAVPAGYRATSAQAELPTANIKKSIEKLSLTTLHYQLLEHYAPPSVLVNADYEIVHLSDRAGEYLHIAGGEPSYNLLRAVRPELRMELRAMLYNAVQGSTVVRSASIPMHLGGEGVMVTMTARPVLDPTDTARGFVLVLFEKVKAADEIPVVQ